MELKCSLTTRLNKEGKPYQVIVVKLTDSYEKLVFLEPAEKELMNVISKKETTEKPEMPFNIN